MNPRRIETQKKRRGKLWNTENHKSAHYLMLIILLSRHMRKYNEFMTFQKQGKKRNSWPWLNWPWTIIVMFHSKIYLTSINMSFELGSKIEFTFQNSIHRCWSFSRASLISEEIVEPWPLMKPQLLLWSFASKPPNGRFSFFLIQCIGVSSDQ